MNVAWAATEMKLRHMWMFAVVAGVAGTACVDKMEPDKGVLADEPPPGETSAAPAESKSDGGALVVAFSLESAHPYTNNLTRAYPIALEGLVPSCARRARVHFASIRTEAGYDYVHLDGPAGRIQSFDGDHTNVWSSWVDLDATKRLTIQLVTDFSVTRDGFRIDSVEVESGVMCPAIAIGVCATNQLDINPSRGVCACPSQPTCRAEDDITLEHVIGGGFTGTVSGHRSVGDTAYNVTYRPGEPAVVAAIGSIDHTRVQTVVRAVIDARLLERSDISESSNWNETLLVKVGAITRKFTRAQGTFPTADAELISRIEDLFVCGTGGALTCGTGYTCDAGQCVPESQGCVCTREYNPVCGVDGRTYGNPCTAGCANVATRHAGECGIAGDLCGGLTGAACAADFKCRFGTSGWTAPFPDAAGTCVAQSYCDAPADCAGLPHIAVPGTWGCAQNLCTWVTGPAWSAVTGWRFASAHPYANQASVWRKLDAPAGATRLRLVVAGARFELESGFDFLEIHSRNAAGAWVVTRRYTGTTGPALTDELVGREFWLRLATDVSVTKYGFELTAQWAN